MRSFAISLGYAQRVDRESAESTGFSAGIHLPGDGLELSRLGFGTAALMSRVNRRDSVRLLETALDCGITHFDTARSYGFGEAELAVGDVLVGRRDRVTVTTKVGILPPRRTVGLSALKAGARGLLAGVPGLRPFVRRGAGLLTQAGRFDARSMQESVETSLRQLRTDYVDYLLLHEPAEDILFATEPLRFLERMQSEGKVRFFGIAGAPDVITTALRRAPQYAPTVQFPHSAFAPCSSWLRDHVPEALFTHSTIGTVGEELRRALEDNDPLKRRWADELGLDVLSPGAVEALLLWSALHTLPGAVVLFSSIRESHIRENAAAVKTAASAEQMQRFEHLLLSWRRHQRGA